MVFYVKNHKVNNYNTWKKVCDLFETALNNFEVKVLYAFQPVDESNYVSAVGEGKLENI